MANEHIGERLRTLRQLAGISARDLDRLAVRTEGHANLIETRPDSAVQTDVASDYARALGASLDYLIAGKGAAPTEAKVRVAVAKARARLKRTGTDG